MLFEQFVQDLKTKRIISQWGYQKIGIFAWRIFIFLSGILYSLRVVAMVFLTSYSNELKQHLKRKAISQPMQKTSPSGYVS